MTKMIEIAQQNLVDRLKDNPCRGIVIGKDISGAVVQIPWIMGRSANSQNRLYVAENDVLRTEAADESKVDDPELIIYPTMQSVGIPDAGYEAHIVSNGDQTETVSGEFERRGVSAGVFYDALEIRFCEPDAPTFTPRITGYASPQNSDEAYLSVLRADPLAREHWLATIEKHGLSREEFEKPGLSPKEITESFYKEVGKLSGLNHRSFPTLRNIFGVRLTPGFGYCVTTYAPGSKTLPAFEGEPFLVPIEKTLEETMDRFRNALEPEWRVALGGKMFHDNKDYLMASPINRFEKVKRGE